MKSVFALLVLLCSLVASGQSFMKGADLYSWRELDGTTWFALLPGTNRQKSWSEVKDARVNEAELFVQLKDLPKGTSVIIWNNDVTLKRDSNTKLELPPEAQRARIVKSAKELGIDLQLAESPAPATSAFPLAKMYEIAKAKDLHVEKEQYMFRDRHFTAWSKRDSKQNYVFDLDAFGELSDLKQVRLSCRPSCSTVSKDSTDLPDSLLTYCRDHFIGAYDILAGERPPEKLTEQIRKIDLPKPSLKNSVIISDEKTNYKIRYTRTVSECEHVMSPAIQIDFFPRGR
jgi:hypothetical protein